MEQLVLPMAEYGRRHVEREMKPVRRLSRGKAPETQETSRAAAKSIKPRMSEDRQAVLDYLRERGAYGGTDNEIQAGTGMNGNTERPRRGELEDAGLVVDSGRRRASTGGRACVVWVAKECADAK